MTISGPGGYSHTFGNNISSGSWGVREEFNIDRTDIFSTSYSVSYAQALDMYNWAAGLISDPQNSYGLLGRNCVDFVRDMFSAGGLGNQISSMIQWLDTPVNHYAAISDWLVANGFGPMWDGVGSFVGAFGELGSHVINAATAAWNGFGDMVGSAYNFISDLGASAGGFIGDLATSIWDFFRLFGKDNSEGDGDMETEGASAVLDDDFLLDSYNVEGGSAAFDAIEVSSTYGDAIFPTPDWAQTEPSWLPANDDVVFRFVDDTHHHADYMFG